MHLLVSHFEGEVQSARVGASHLGACVLQFERVWSLAWGFMAQKRTLVLAVKLQQKPSVGHTRSLTPAAVRRRNANIVQSPQKWYQIEALVALIALMQVISRMTRACRSHRSFEVRVATAKSCAAGTVKAVMMKIHRYALLMMWHQMV